MTAAVTHEVQEANITPAPLREALMEHALARDVLAVFFHSWDGRSRIDCVCVGRVSCVQLRNIIITVNGDCSTILELRHVKRVEVIRRPPPSETSHE